MAIQSVCRRLKLLDREGRIAVRCLTRLDAFRDVTRHGVGARIEVSAVSTVPVEESAADLTAGCSPAISRGLLWIQILRIAGNCNLIARIYL